MRSRESTNICPHGKGIPFYFLAEPLPTCPPLLSLRRVSDSPEFRCPHFSESRNPEAGLWKSETGTRKRAGLLVSARPDAMTLQRSQAYESQPALVRRDVDMQLFSLLMNASLSITASSHARSGPGVWARVFGMPCNSAQLLHDAGCWSLPARHCSRAGEFPILRNSGVRIFPNPGTRRPDFGNRKPELGSGRASNLDDRGIG